MCGAGEQPAAETGVLLVETRGGLVDEKELHVGGECPRYCDTLALARGEPADREVEPALEAHLDEGIACRRPLVARAAQTQAEPDVLERREVRDEAGLLRDQRDMTAAESASSARPSPLSDAPATVTSPAVGRSSPASRCSRVVLPVPERPTSAVSTPASNRRLTQSSTTRAPCRLPTASSSATAGNPSVATPRTDRSGTGRSVQQAAAAAAKAAAKGGGESADTGLNSSAKGTCTRNRRPRAC